MRLGRQRWVGIAYLLLAILTYELLNHIPRGTPLDLSTEFDKSIPVLPIFVVPYLSFIPILFVALPLLLWRNAKEFKLFGLTVFITQMVLNALYLLVPATLPRPTLSGSDVFTFLLRDLVWQLDGPINTFPSNHVALSVIAILVLGFLGGWRKYLALQIWLAVICFSTLFVHQHVLADVVGGVVCGALVTLLVSPLRSA